MWDKAERKRGKIEQGGPILAVGPELATPKHVALRASLSKAVRDTFVTRVSRIPEPKAAEKPRGPLRVYTLIVSC